MGITPATDWLGAISFHRRPQPLIYRQHRDLTRRVLCHHSPIAPAAIRKQFWHSRSIDCRRPCQHVHRCRRSHSTTLGFSVSKCPAPQSSTAAREMSSFDRLGQYPQGSTVSVSPATVSGLDQLRDGRLNKVWNASIFFLSYFHSFLRFWDIRVCHSFIFATTRKTIIRHVASRKKRSHRYTRGDRVSCAFFGRGKFKYVIHYSDYNSHYLSL